MKIKEAVKLTNSKWLNQFDVKYVGKGGEERSWLLSSRARQPKCITGRFDVPDAVVIVAHHEAADKLVLTREFRVPLADYEYGFPAGLVDTGESVEEAARRELEEETGLTVCSVMRVSPPIYSSAGMTDESVAMVYVKCRGESSTESNTASELIEVLLVSRDGAAALCREKNLKFDVKTWLILSGFAENGRL